jgi:hypothetical protein
MIVWRLRSLGAWPVSALPDKKHADCKYGSGVVAS